MLLIQKSLCLCIWILWFVFRSYEQDRLKEVRVDWVKVPLQATRAVGTRTARRAAITCVRRAPIGGVGEQIQMWTPVTSRCGEPNSLSLPFVLA